MPVKIFEAPSIVLISSCHDQNKARQNIGVYASERL